MPKYVEPEEEGGGEEGDANNVEPGKGKAKNEAPKSKKELGRLKSQKAVARVLETGVGGDELGEKDDSVDVEARESKRSRSEVGEDGDVVMG